MITDEQRREVAKELRDLADTGCIRYAEEFYDELREIIAFNRDGSFDGVAESLADLIDRPTCEMTECSIDHGSRSWGMRCSRCGTEFEHEKPAYGWRYCPNCGAEVVNHGV